MYGSSFSLCFCFFFFFKQKTAYEMRISDWSSDVCSSDLDRDGAAELFDAYMPFTRYEQQPGYGLAVRKEILRRRGGIRSARARWPAPDLGREGMAEIDRKSAV